MIARSLKAKFLVFAVFFIGIATGVLIANFYTTRVSGSRPAAADPRDRAGAQRDITKFQDYLGLNQEQRLEMNKIGEETRTEFENLRKETSPRFQAIQEASRSKIREILTDEQRQKYDQFRKDMDERRRNRERDHDANHERPRPNK